MIGSQALRRRINLASQRVGPNEDRSKYWKDICTGIETYFNMMIPGSSLPSKQRAEHYADQAKKQLDALAIIKEAERQRINERGGFSAEIEAAKAVLFQPDRGPGTEPHMVDDDYNVFDDDNDNPSTMSYASQQRQLQMRQQRQQTPRRQRREPEGQDRYDMRDVFGSQQPTWMPSGVHQAQRRLRQEAIADSDDYDDDDDDDEDDDADDPFAGGASGSKKRGYKPKPKKRISTKSKGKKKLVVKRKK